MKNTLLVNLFAGPGAGKSTGAAYIFAKLKMAGVDAELVTEYAKDRVWQEDQFPLQRCQLYVTGKQLLRIERVLGKVDVVITDSPVAIGSMYTDEKPYKDACIYAGKKYENSLNVFIRRHKSYNPNGRNQSEEEAKQIDEKIMNMFTENNMSFMTIAGTENGYDDLVEIIKNYLSMKGEK